MVPRVDNDSSQSGFEAGFLFAPNYMEVQHPMEPREVSNKLFEVVSRMREMREIAGFTPETSILRTSYLITNTSTGET